ncbi:MAG: hypothetical protein K6E73_10780 [Bacteroidales bacterium]|nr:hypothetical protein [Bacteroidales bacterium]
MDEIKEQQQQQQEGQTQTQTEGGQELSDLEYLRQRTGKRHPDMTFEDDAAWHRQMRADADEDDRRLADYDRNARAVEDLFASDPRSAEWWVMWKKNKGKSPIAAMVRIYGTDFLREGLDDPDLAEQIEAAEKEYLDTITEGRQYGETVQKNLEKTLDTADEYGKANGLSDEEVDALLADVFERFKHIQLGEVTAEDLDWARKMKDYDETLAAARAEGEVAGRNARIREQLRKPKAGDGVAALGGGASGTGGRGVNITNGLEDFQRGFKSASEAPEVRSRQRYGQ